MSSLANDFFNTRDEEADVVMNKERCRVCAAIGALPRISGGAHGAITANEFTGGNNSTRLHHDGATIS